VRAILTAADQIEIAARRVLDRLGTPDAVIHNAGRDSPSNRRRNFDRSVRRTARSEPARTVSAHARAASAMCAAQAAGRIVYVSSISATLGSAKAAAVTAPANGGSWHDERA
jgi:NAD(P)-dependent dehydrogenase (short-subunit alcohol dehydrogenase family)